MLLKIQSSILHCMHPPNLFANMRQGCSKKPSWLTARKLQIQGLLLSGRSTPHLSSPSNQSRDLPAAVCCACIPLDNVGWPRSCYDSLPRSSGEPAAPSVTTRTSYLSGGRNSAEFPPAFRFIKNTTVGTGRVYRVCLGGYPLKKSAPDEHSHYP